MQKTDEQWQIALDLIKKFRISQVVIGEVIGLKRSVVSLKFTNNGYNKFTDEQKDKITKYLLGMGKVLVNSLGK